MSIINASSMYFTNFATSLYQLSNKKKPIAKKPDSRPKQASLPQKKAVPCSQHHSVVVCPKSISTAESYLKRDAVAKHQKLSEYLYSLSQQTKPMSEQTKVYLKAYLPLKYLKDMIELLPKEVKKFPRYEQVKFICLVLALIHSESCFKPKLRSLNDGAYGLMQVKPDAAKEIGVKIKNPEDLFNIRLNLKAGMAYFKRLEIFYYQYYLDQGFPLDRIDPLLFAILAYNQGPKGAAKTIRGWVKEWDKDPQNIDKPISMEFVVEHNTYIRKALAKSGLYEQIYSQEIDSQIGEQ